MLNIVHMSFFIMGKAMRVLELAQFASFIHLLKYAGMSFYD